MRVSFQGELGAFSEQASRAFFKDTSLVLLPKPTFEQVFQSVASGEVLYAVLPIENSLFGSVHANYDLLQEYQLSIVGELKLRIVHNLMAMPGESLQSLQKVYSHPQALGQCKVFLQENLAHAEIIPTYDTAGSAKMIASGQYPNSAAIASLNAAVRYNLEVLAKGIESNHQNFTRFLVLAQQPLGTTEASINDKTSIIYAMRDNVPGALFKSLAVFALREIDLLKIESRPLIGSPFAYLFYLDFTGAMSQDTVQRALAHLEEITAYVKVLGSYPQGKMIG